MAENEQTERPPFWDRGLFWFGVFGTMALIGLLVIAPKYSVRRSKMDLNFKGREISYEVRLKQREEYLAAHPEVRDLPANPWFNFALWLLGIPATALVVSLVATWYLRIIGHADESSGEPPPRE